MGTTTRVGSGARNEPNWGNLSTAITSAAKAIADLEKEDQRPESSVPAEVLLQAKYHNKLVQRRDGHVRSAFERLVKLGGGSRTIASGGSAKVGRAGIRASSRMSGFFGGVATSGLETILATIGFGALAGRTIREVVDYLISWCGDTATGMDETAANQAICTVLRQLEIEAKGDMTNLENLFKEYANTEKLAELLCTFFGVYIFEYLSERFEERLRQLRGETVTRETFDRIRREIMGRVKRLNDSRPVAKIDWVSATGKAQIEKIFEAVIKIEE